MHANSLLFYNIFSEALILFQNFADIIIKSETLNCGFEWCKWKKIKLQLKLGIAISHISSAWETHSLRYEWWNIFFASLDLKKATWAVFSRKTNSYFKEAGYWVHKKTCLIKGKIVRSALDFISFIIARRINTRR